ncbi:MAG TPA: ATP-binding cassette domain-containing protein, partial [Mycobacterium sp.]|nr:ATP-binding cassette domain-containing protein [Mycobacterium sp.]
MTSTRSDARPGRLLTPSRALSPVEMAQAAVMGALSAALAIVSVVVPFAGGLSLLVTVPMGLLGFRYRLRVLLAAAFAASTVAFLIAGISGFMVVLNCAYVGGMTGIIKRRRWGTAAVVAASVAAGIVSGMFIIGALTVLARLRTVTFEAMTANVDGVVAVMSQFEPFRQSAADTRAMFGVALQYWPVLLLGYSIFTMMIVSLVGWWALSRVLERLRGIPDVHKLETPVESGPVAPVPVRLREARFRYPGADHDALRPLTMSVDPGEHVAVTGANGSGKTTLMLLLCGRAPTSGVIDRPGAVGLGQLGGTAVVMQHPESQVLGSRVADDVVWGLPPGTTTDVPGLLGEVGLAGMEDRDTGGLSGGELQRLALAAALARQPSLLIADEVTTMVDQRGREALLGVLSDLTDRHRVGLVHITHYGNEAEIADKTVNLSDSQDNMVMVANAAAPAPTLNTTPHRGDTVLQLDRVGHVYADGTPWAKSALRDVSFTVSEGDGVLIHGGNGSGKSTLAWIMAGLTTPT